MSNGRELDHEVTKTEAGKRGPAARSTRAISTGSARRTGAMRTNESLFASLRLRGSTFFFCRTEQREAGGVAVDEVAAPDGADLAGGEEAGDGRGGHRLAG